MCELFAMSSRVPATVRLSLEELARRGGLTGPHKDGWGIAYYHEGDVRLVKEPLPAADSACLRFIEDHPFHSAMVVGHIRRATQGVKALRNSQPFARELGGAMHVFAHNGHLDGVGLWQLPLGCHRPIGDTDSERAFCLLLARLSDLWRDAGGPPALGDRLAVVSRFAADMRALGPANFIYADGDALFAHGHRRMHGDAGIRPPGLHMLCRHCANEPGAPSPAGLEIESPAGGQQQVVLFASVPLTDERGWQPLGEGATIAARDGIVVGGPTERVS